ncbi:hypothetical protein GQ55_4G013300 [Panicum hallii var. hallii]|uniref:Uncharacterized protein n=1 Tax=Panicum hallii var. hallii TaxID=1504633 RepID=A0A2T7DU46_9POAL|nr:hypothetical protein GQ55_4G013300 [Panicum hallii var. hallii]
MEDLFLRIPPTGWKAWHSYPRSRSVSHRRAPNPSSQSLYARKNIAFLGMGFFFKKTQAKTRQLGSKMRGPLDAAPRLTVQAGPISVHHQIESKLLLYPTSRSSCGHSAVHAQSGNPISQAMERGRSRRRRCPAVAPRSSVTASPCRFAELPPRGSSYPSWEASNPSERRGHGGAKEPPPRGRRGRTGGQRHWCVGRVSNHPSDVRRRLPPKLQTLAEGARAEGPWRSRQGKGPTESPRPHG